MAKRTGAPIQEFRGRACTWIHLGQANLANIKALGEKFSLHEHDLREILPPLQHTKCIVRPNYVFMVFIVPIRDEAAGGVREVEFDAFMSDRTLVTVNHGNELVEIKTMLDEMTNAVRRELILSAPPAEVLLTLMGRIYKSVFPLLLQLSSDIRAVEKKMFSSYEREETIRRVLTLKNGNAKARNAMQNHRLALKEFRAARAPSASPPAAQLDHLMSQTVDIWNTLEAQRESIDTLHETNDALVSFRINEIMKTLTIFSVIVFPLSLIAGIFGMNTVAGMPFLGNPHGFAIVLAIMATASIAMLTVFKLKKWI
jgi:magnesium transporter